jgi:hypothetical protein
MAFPSFVIPPSDFLPFYEDSLSSFSAAFPGKLSASTFIPAQPQEPPATPEAALLKSTKGDVSPNWKELPGKLL